MKGIKSTIDMMNMVADKRITETPELTGQFMVFPNSFASGNVGQKPLSRMSREQLAAFLKAESGNAQSAHFVTPAAEAPPPTPEIGLAIGVLKQAAYDLRRFRTATKAVDRELYVDAHSWVTAYDSSWPYSFMNVCKLLNLCPEMVRAELLADASLGPFFFGIWPPGLFSQKVAPRVPRVFKGGENPEPVQGNQLAASI